jgi:hypothetical protein
MGSWPGPTIQWLIDLAPRWRARIAEAQHEVPDPEAAVRQIAALYAVEATVRGMSPADRLAARRDVSAPIVERWDCVDVS